MRCLNILVEIKQQVLYRTSTFVQQVILLLYYFIESINILSSAMDFNMITKY